MLTYYYHFGHHVVWCGMMIFQNIYLFTRFPLILYTLYTLYTLYSVSNAHTDLCTLYSVLNSPLIYTLYSVFNAHTDLGVSWFIHLPEDLYSLHPAFTYHLANQLIIGFKPIKSFHAGIKFI